MSARGGTRADQKFVKLRSISEKKSPIYVHKSNITTSFTDLEVNELNVISTKSEQSLNKKSNHTIVKCLNDAHVELKDPIEDSLSIKYNLDKIEETYWSQWKPNKDGILMEVARVLGKTNRKSPKKNVLNVGDCNENFLTSETDTGVVKVEAKQQATLSSIEEATDEDKELVPTEETEEFKFLKHTDSFILNSKKQLIEKPRFQQPRCIRLYKNTSASSYMRGGSYPLKPCLKKESTFKGNTRRGLGGTYSANFFKSTRNFNKVKII